MSAKNHFKSEIVSEISVTNSDNKPMSAEPLPLPPRAEIISHGKTSSQSYSDNNSDYIDNDNDSNNEGLTALINNISITNNTNQENSIELNQNRNLTQNLINIVTKIKSNIYAGSKSVFGKISKLSAGTKFLLQFFKFISSYLVIKFDEETNENNETTNSTDNPKTDKNIDSIKKQHKNKSDSHSNIVTKNQSNSTFDSEPSSMSDSSYSSPLTTTLPSDRFGDDNDIYEGSLWQNILIKSAVLAAALLILVAGYVGIKSILYPQPVETAVINDPENQITNNSNNNTNSTADKSSDTKNSTSNSTNSPTFNSSDSTHKLSNNATPAKQSTTNPENKNYTNNKITQPVLPSIDLPNSAIAKESSNIPQPSTNHKEQTDTTELNSKKVNDLQPLDKKSAEPPLPTDIFASDFPMTNPPANPSTDSINIFTSDSTPSAPTPTPTPTPTPFSDQNINSAFPSLPPTNSEMSKTPETSETLTTNITTQNKNNSAIENNSSASLNPLTDSAALLNDTKNNTTNNTNITDTNSKQNNNQPVTNEITQTNNTTNKIENKNEPDQKSDTKFTENVNNSNTEMAPLAVGNHSPISVTNNPANSTRSSPFDSGLAIQDINSANSTTSVLDKNPTANESELNKVTSAPMESLHVANSTPNILTDTNTAIRVPPQEHTLNPNQSESNAISGDTSTNLEQPISVTKNDNSLPIIPEEKIQPKFTDPVPPSPATNNIELPETLNANSMRNLHTVVPNETNPSIPTADSIAPVTNISFTETSNSEPTLRIPTESQMTEKSDKLITVAQNNTHTIISPNSTNTGNSVSSGNTIGSANNVTSPAASPSNTTTMPTLVFDNNSINNRNDKSTESNDTSTNNIPSTPAKLFNETNNPPPNSITNSVTQNMPASVPSNTDDKQTNELFPLLPSNITKSDNSPKHVMSEELTALQDNAPAELAESNPSYRRSPLPLKPAVVQIHNSDNVLPSGTTASVYREQLDREITRSPENAELYTVKSGDTYMSICDNYYGTGLLYRALAVHNRNRGAAWIPAEGTQIEIPTADYLKTNYNHVLTRNNRYTPLNNNNSTSSILISTAQPNINPATQPVTQPATQVVNQTPAQSIGTSYIVKQGDSVFKIAQDQLKDTSRWREIIKFNSDKLKSARDLKPGMEIILPTTTAAGYKRLN
ncbi:MAG: LysM peptidoglycan-binding domain-containing protein [Planctomycetaceae bacterium]|jgi:hypothetical protein|nr:LysM peptidoglycan-binding domain-containing protein [Planctomycetaceae bacterium]